LIKVTRYKINIQKSVAFLYTNNAQIKKEIRETILFTVASKTMKYLRINLMKETKDFFNEHYKPLKRNIEDIIRWKDLLCLWISRINIVKMVILPKATYMFNATPIKISMTLSTEIEKDNHETHMENKRAQIAKAILSKKTNGTGITIPDFKLYYRAITKKQHGIGTKADRKTSGSKWKIQT
jgi:hypothetical protein